MPLPSFAVTGNLRDVPGENAFGELVTNGLTSALLQFTPEPDEPVTWDGQLYRPLDPLSVTVSDDGSISDAGNPVRLLANDPGLSVTGLRWKVVVTIDGLIVGEWWFTAPSDGDTVDLSTIAFTNARPFGSRIVSVLITGTGTLGIASTRTVTAAITGAGRLGKVGAGSMAVGAVITGSGVLGKVGSGSLTVGATATGAGVLDVTQFVVRDPDTGYLMLGGQRFRFAGNNGELAGLTESTTTYGETVTSGLHVMNHAAIDDYIAAAVGMNARVVRIFLNGIGRAGTFMPTINTYDHTALEGLDYAIPQLAAHGIKLIAALVDDYDAYGSSKYQWCRLSSVTPDANAHEFFTNSTVITNFKAYVSALLNHTNVYTGVKYLADEVFVAWESGNELTDNTNYQSLLDWTADLAQYIKVTVGAKQLVFDGRWGILGPGNVIPVAHMTNTYIDAFTEHTYDQWRTPAHMANVAAITHNYRKAFYPGEWPLTGMSNGTPPASIGWGNADMITAAEGNKNIDGTLFWSLHAQGNFHGGGFCTHYPGDDTSMVIRVAAQKNHSIAMAGPTLTNAVDHAKAATLVGPDVDAAQWVARSGANVSGVQYVLPSAAGGGSAYSGALVKDLTNSEVVVRLSTKNPGSGSSGCGMYVAAGQAPYNTPLFGFIIDGTTVKYRYDFGSGTNETTETYNSTTHRWLRLRASADATLFSAYPIASGTIYWDVSSDGVNWTNKRTLTPVGMVLTSVYPVLYNDNWGGDGTSGTAVFDHFNLANQAPMVTTVSITGAGVLGYIGSGSLTVTAAITSGGSYPSTGRYPSPSTYPAGA